MKEQHADEVNVALQDVVLVARLHCPGCNYRAPVPNETKVVSIGRTSSGYTIEGVIQPKQTRCPACGQIVATILHNIPIECAGISCPKCGDPSKLRYQVDSVDADGDTFTFSAHADCAKCKVSRSVQKVIKSVAKHIKIEAELSPHSFGIKIGNT